MKILAKFFNLIKFNQHSIFLALCIGLMSFISYNLGQIDALQQTPIKIVESEESKTESSNFKADIYSATQTENLNDRAGIKVLDTRVVASKNSTTKKSDSTTLHQFIDYVFTIDYKPFRRIKDPKTGFFTSVDYSQSV